MLELNRPELFRQAAYISGQWSVGNGESWLEVNNPADGTLVGRVPRIGAAELQLAIEFSEQAQKEYRQWTAKKRSQVLLRWAQLIQENKQDLALIMTSEQGKPLAEALGEIDYATSFVTWFAEEAKRVYGDTIPAPFSHQRISVVRQPVGVCAAITPWNFPSGMVTRKVAPALAAGCSMILKPAPQTPFSALALGVLAEEAGIPPGVLTIVTGDALEIGPVLTDSQIIRKLSFTGSTAVGKKLMAACAGTVKRLSLELGGNAPFIVFDDADIDAAIAGAMASKFRNAGQTCVCANRFLVQEGIYDVFVERLIDAARKLKVAKGTEPGASIGPLIDRASLEKIERLVEDAEKTGAKIRLGGGRHTAGALFYVPTVITGVTQCMAIANVEIFGPVIAITRFKEDGEAVEIANATRYGLAAYLYTESLNRSTLVSEALDFGIVGINEGMISTECAPFGGFKESGFGKEGSRYGIDEYSEKKYICVGNLK